MSKASFERCPHGRYPEACDPCVRAKCGPGHTVARHLFKRIVEDSGNRIDRTQAVCLVAKMLGRTPLDMGFIDIGLDQVYGWQSPLPTSEKAL